VGAVLRNVAEDQALNAVAAVKEGMKEGFQGFLKTNRYFKYKALVVAVWLAFGGVGAAITFRGTGDHSEENLGARLKMNSDPDHPAFMFVNDGDAPWQNVVVVINGQWRTTISRVEPGADFTVTPKHLVGREGVPAPSNLHATDVVLKSKHGEAVLMKDGHLQE
jgi:hypothetical protein